MPAGTAHARGGHTERARARFRSEVGVYDSASGSMTSHWNTALKSWKQGWQIQV